MMHAMLLAAALAAAPPFTALDKTGAENAVRHLSGTELTQGLKAAKKPGDFYAQAPSPRASAIR